MCEEYYKPVKVQCYIADYVSWVPRLTFLDLQSCSQNRTHLYVRDLPYHTGERSKGGTEEKLEYPSQDGVTNAYSRCDLMPTNPGGSVGKESACKAGDPGLIPG